MLLRNYQQRFVNSSLEALKNHHGVLGVGATGCGKTVMLSSVAREFKSALVLQHRTELLEQNSKTFSWVNPALKYGLVDSKNNDWSKPYTFGMVQTIARRMDEIKGYDLIVIDEAHHTAANQHAEIIEAVRNSNPDAKLFGVTATPERADKKDLSKFYETISDQIKMNELIKNGFLVPPLGYVIKVADSEQLKAAKDDDEKIEALLNLKATNERVIEEWRKIAGNRQTVIFCQTRKHAIDVTEAFQKAGIKCDYIDGVMSERERKKRLKALDTGKLQVIVNVNVLTEGFDSQPISCVILLRGSSSKSSLIQMVGRGLRKLDPSRYPNVVKKDCVVLDFGVSLMKHGNLEAGDRLDFDRFDDTDDAVIQCDQCGAPVEPKETHCLECGYQVRDEAGNKIERESKKVVTNFSMTEFELFQKANFHYERFRGESYIASAWTAFVMVHPFNGVWYTVAAAKRKHAKIIGCSTNKIEALATGEDFLSQHGAADLAGKHQRWLYEPATPKQLNLLPELFRKKIKTKHQACCMLTLCEKFDRILSLIHKHYNSVGKYYL